MEQKVYKKQVGQIHKIHCFLSAFISLCLLSHFISLFIFLLKNKNNLSNDQRSLTYDQNTLFLPLFSLKTSAWPSLKLLNSTFHSPGRLTHKKRMRSSANTNYRTQSSKLRRLYSVIWTSSTLLAWRKQSLIKSKSRRKKRLRWS